MFPAALAPRVELPETCPSYVITPIMAHACVRDASKLGQPILLGHSDALDNLWPTPFAIRFWLCCKQSFWLQVPRPAQNLGVASLFCS
jgi:hypothetical protein